MVSELRVRLEKIKDVRFEKGVLIEASAGVGMVANIAANYIINELKMDQVAAMDSPDFPPVSMVYNGKPKLPCRIYACGDRNLALFTGEVPLPSSTHRDVVSVLLDWASESGCNSFISLDAIPEEGDEETPQQVWAVGADEISRKRIASLGLKELGMGMLTGVSAIMLNRGRMGKLDVTGLFAEARPYIPDAAAAAALIETLKVMLHDRLADISTEPLAEQAKEIQGDLERVRKQAEPAMKEPYNLYR